MSMTAEDTALQKDLEVVTFSVAGQSYCLDIQSIREIRRWSPVTALPHAPADVLGVMNLRGSVIPIYDLAARFGLDNIRQSERNVIIVVALEGNIVGLLVEAVSEVLSVSRADIQPTPDIRSEATRRCITGVISVNGDMIRMADLKAVIHPQKVTPA
ncbi:CheW protein [Rhodovulum imhoffii]|uniref:CheW protein n=1 Tax=Rhodovulum imhoffii TaxID=365340 RepID=A0A2T5BRH3_9RHOB|nr:chemotaxis protein CheW [Rhodovulum imhoffii]MBK5934000.1 chemotaxis protein CheW [Rhodovulum imhoffii]PTN01885.1 CheW protein [Rhodovulum imhoffii]